MGADAGVPPGEARLSVAEYLELGLRLGRHVDGFVDAYYGPPDLARRVAGEPLRAPAALADDARRLLAELPERGWLAAQVRGLWTSARKLAGEPIGYRDEVEACYGVRPALEPEDSFAEAHRRLDAVLPGGGPLADRFVAWREAQVVPPDRLEAAVAAIAEDLRERTDRLFGLPDGEHVDFVLESDKPWSGFNYYLGDLHSRVAVNVDLPVPSTSLGHLVAHEAYPGHHTEHCRKEVGLVRTRHLEEETIFLVGTPQCLVAEGLADLGLEVVVGERSEEWLASHLRPLGIPYDAETAAAVSGAAEALGRVRGNVGILLHEEGRPADDVVAYVERWSLQARRRAEKSVEFQLDPTWRAYVTCYVEGLPLCRRFVGGDPARFQRLVTEQLTPADLAA